MGQYEELKKKTKEAGLKDFENWVAAQGEIMEDANNRGDSHGVYRTVKVLARKTEKPPTNLKTDDQGNVLRCAADIASR